MRGKVGEVEVKVGVVLKFWLVPLLAVSIDCFCNVEVQRCKESDFLGSDQIASGDLSARTHTQTNVRLV